MLSAHAASASLSPKNMNGCDGQRYGGDLGKSHRSTCSGSLLMMVLREQDETDDGTLMMMIFKSRFKKQDIRHQAKRPAKVCGLHLIHICSSSETVAYSTTPG